MELNNRTMQTNFRNSFVALVSMIGLSGHVYAAPPTNGQLVVINSVGVGAAKSSVSVVVNDSTGPCSSTATLAYNGVLVIPWNAANVHSSTSCTGITSVNVSAKATITGVVQYDSTANSTPPASATAPTNFVAPTTAITNLVLIVTGNSSPATTNNATTWGSALGVSPIYSVSDGSLVTTGVMGSVGSAGMKASRLMLKHGVRPAGQELYTIR